MDLLLVLLGSFMALLVSAIYGYPIVLPLAASMVAFMAVLIGRGFALGALLKMAIAGSRKSLVVIHILLIIGALTATWMAAGTVPALVYYGVQWINPHTFIVAAFLLTALVSLLLGTSFGAVSTVGIALMIMSSGSPGNNHWVAGAIIAGAYVGDRCSPMSSSALLIATLTQTKLYTNIRNMWVTSLLPLGLSTLIYGIVAWRSPVSMTARSFLPTIDRLFAIHPVTLLPALCIVLLSIAQVEVKRSMVVSTAVAMAIALFHQHYGLLDILRFMVVGFSVDPAMPLYTVFRGGGLMSMVNVSLIVVISTAFAGLFAGTQVLHRIEYWVGQTRSQRDRFLSTCIVGTGAAAFGCTQTIAILLTQQLVEKKYQESETGTYKLALDLENTVVLIAPLVPWNIAGLVPATILDTNASFIPFAVYLYLVPLLNLISTLSNSSGTSPKPWFRGDLRKRLPTSG